jgi:hypothetical protein
LFVEAEPIGQEGSQLLHKTEHAYDYPRQLPSAQEISPQPLYFNSNSLWLQIQNEASKYKQDSAVYDPGAWHGYNSNSFTGTIVRNIGLNIRPLRIAWGWGSQVW